MSQLTWVVYNGSKQGYVVDCQVHGDVTNEESNFTADNRGVSVEQASIYRRRHLAKHLVALGEEIAEAAR